MTGIPDYPDSRKCWTCSKRTWSTCCDACANSTVKKRAETILEQKRVRAFIAKRDAMKKSAT
jgi:hypothetical protein